MRKLSSFNFGLVIAIASQCAFAQSGLVDGQVTKVDQSAGKITIKHGPIKKLGMDQGMTMVSQRVGGKCTPLLRENSARVKF